MGRQTPVQGTEKVAVGASPMIYDFKNQVFIRSRRLFRACPRPPCAWVDMGGVASGGGVGPYAIMRSCLTHTAAVPHAGRGLTWGTDPHQQRSAKTTERYSYVAHTHLYPNPQLWEKAL